MENVLRFIKSIGLPSFSKRKENFYFTKPSPILILFRNFVNYIWNVFVISKKDIL